MHIEAHCPSLARHQPQELSFSFRWPPPPFIDGIDRQCLSGEILITASGVSHQHIDRAALYS
jgi:hypothetical protein